jgi:hypothetical protein
MVRRAVPAELPAPVLVLDSPYPKPLAEFLGALSLLLSVAGFVAIILHSFR